MNESHAKIGSAADGGLLLLMVLWTFTAALGWWLHHDPYGHPANGSTSRRAHPPTAQVASAEDSLQQMAQELQTTRKKLAGMLPQ